MHLQTWVARGVCWGWLLAALRLASPSCAAAEDNFEGLFESAAPSVVTIYVESGGQGSGVILHRGGFIATAAHVVEREKSIEVQFIDETTAPAEIVTLSRTHDLALLKVEEISDEADVARLGDSDALEIGQPVFAVGTPRGLRYTMTTGIVSGLRVDNTSAIVLSPDEVLQTDITLNPGNSGGPIFNLDGEVVGITSYALSSGDAVENVGLNFAVTSNMVRRRLFERPIPYIGVSLRRIPTDVAEALNWPWGECLLVEYVHPGTPADEAGLQGGTIPVTIGDVEVQMGGDVIVRVGEYTPDESEAIHAYLQGLEKGDDLVYEVIREGQARRVKVRIDSTIDVPALPRERRRRSED